MIASNNPDFPFRDTMLPPLKEEDHGKSPSPPKHEPRQAKGASLKRFETINHFVDYQMKGLHASAQIVWFILWRNTKQNQTASVSFTEMARLSGMCEKAMRNGLKQLKEKNLVEILKLGRFGKGSSVYRVKGVPG
jgi:hypothetical protein